MTAILADLAEIKADVAKHEAVINGNGQPGVKVKIATLETNYTNLLEKIGNIEKKLDGMTKAAWGIAATIGGGVLLYLFTKVLPDIVSHIGVVTK